MVPTLSLGAGGNLSGCLDLHLSRLIERVSPLDAEQSFVPAVYREIRRMKPDELELLRPSLRGHDGRGLQMDLKVTSFEAFAPIEKALKNSGFWVFFTPVKPDVRAAVGHAWLSVGGNVFDRYGPWIVRSQSLNEFKDKSEIREILESGYVLSQFFEVSESSVQKIEKFMHDRVWFFNAGDERYQPKFTDRPLSQPPTDQWLENCMTFVYSWLLPKWSEMRPELQSLQAEVGKIRLSEVPSHQGFLNEQIPAYRGTVLITNHPDAITQSLKSEGWSHDPAGRQLLFSDALTDINH